MKRKPKTVAKRNPFVALAAMRKAGVHRKSEKAVRRQEKVKILGGLAHLAEHPVFTRLVASSILAAPTTHAS